MESGKTVSRKINLTPIYAVHDLGTYRVRANVYFADLNKFFYSEQKVFEVTNARPIWQRTVGLPEGTSGGGNVRTYSLLMNRFPDHTSLYVRVEDKDSNVVYATYPLGRIITFAEPQEEIDRADDAVAVSGGMREVPATQTTRNAPPKLSTRPSEMPKDDGQ